MNDGVSNGKETGNCHGLGYIVAYRAGCQHSGSRFLVSIMNVSFGLVKGFVIEQTFG